MGTPPAQRRRSTDQPGYQEGLQTIVENLADGVIILGEAGNIRYANPAAQSLFGRAGEQLVGADLGFPAIAERSTEIDIMRPTGQSVTAETHLVEMLWQGERARVVTLRDVTDRKLIEERLRQLEAERAARAEAESASQAKSEFLATMSHELRTPLNAVIGYAELLDFGVAGALTPEQRQHVTRIGRSARHLLGLVNEVLDLARVEAGRLTVQNRAAAVTEAVDAALSLVAPPADARGIQLGGWYCGKGILYRGDDNRVRQILVNLLNNAVKFTPAGGHVTVDCEIVSTPERGARLAGPGPWVRFRVSDTGIGIPHDRLASIFDPFVQVESGKTRSSDGSGLGLTISRRLARLMGGDLTVSTELGTGSTFTLWLSEASAAEREAADWRAESPDAAARLQGLAETGNALLRELPTLCETFVDRLRVERIVPNAHVLRSTQLADHMVGYVAHVASMLKAIEEARGQPSRLIVEGAELQTMVAERHGAQRARLGWTAEVLRKEWSILREEIERVVRRTAAAAAEARGIGDAMVVLDRFLEQGEDASIVALQRVLEEQTRSRDDRAVAQSQDDEKPPRGESNAESLAAEESLGG